MCLPNIFLHIRSKFRFTLHILYLEISSSLVTFSTVADCMSLLVETFDKVVSHFISYSFSLKLEECVCVST